MGQKPTLAQKGNSYLLISFYRDRAHLKNKKVFISGKSYKTEQEMQVVSQDCLLINLKINHKEVGESQIPFACKSLRIKI